MILIYHGGCTDGFCAAWAMSHILPKDVILFPGIHGQPPPDVTGHEVYIVDFSYKRDVLIEMAKVAKSIFILDHHITAKNDLVDLPENVTVTFDMGKSGAQLAYEHVFDHGNAHDPDVYKFLHQGKWLCDYVGDRDIWTWKLPQSKEVSAALASYPYEFEVYDQISADGWEKLAGEGAPILRLEANAVKKKVEQAEMCKFNVPGKGEFRVPLINTTTLISEILGTLAEEHPFAIGYFIAKGQVIFSMRSRKSGEDVSEIAKIFGGGGHKQAAGFQRDLPFLQELLNTQELLNGCKT